MIVLCPIHHYFNQYPLPPLLSPCSIPSHEPLLTILIHSRHLSYLSTLPRHFVTLAPTHSILSHPPLHIPLMPFHSNSLPHVAPHTPPFHSPSPIISLPFFAPFTLIPSLPFLSLPSFPLPHTILKIDATASCTVTKQFYHSHTSADHARYHSNMHS
jgi:hypothetical protein